MLDNFSNLTNGNDFIRGITFRIAQQDKRWTVDALRRALLTEAQRKQILEEIIDGESAINPGLTRTMPRAQNKPVARQTRSVA
ncbi:hypothetical protein [Herminiimonas aquatilis]|uniref:Uncharacterized protein n=1 Tax=Herminiimonas aquatilis TaxID=345342 RepID=A0ABW2J212_9BURK